MDDDDDKDNVGYRRPPKRSRFVKGQSGNPKGRPKGSKALDKILSEISGENIKVTQNGRTRYIPRLRAIVLQLGNKAAAGDPKAVKEYLSLLKQFPDLERTLQPPPTFIIEVVDDDGNKVSRREPAGGSDPDLPES